MNCMLIWHASLGQSGVMSMSTTHHMGDDSQAEITSCIPLGELRLHFTFTTVPRVPLPNICTITLILDKKKERNRT